MRQIAIHKNYKRVTDGLKVWYDFIGLVKCQPCRALAHVCQGCGSSYSLSTAMAEHVYCSMACESPDEFKPRKKK